MRSKLISYGLWWYHQQQDGGGNIERVCRHMQIEHCEVRVSSPVAQRSTITWKQER
jgi:hypothetical protein